MRVINIMLIIVLFETRTNAPKFDFDANCTSCCEYNN